jgi:lysophospholipase
MRDFLRRAKIADFNSDSYMDKVANDDNNLPTIGIAISGGGYRALLTGAGAIAAFDDRTTGSKEPGHVGGLLQSSTYVSGLSGGGWLVGSLFVNNFTSVQDILAGEAAGDTSMWNFQRSMLEGPKTSRIPGLSLIEYWKTIYDQVMSKVDAGFNSSLTDYWARGLSFQMINASNGGPGVYYSKLRSVHPRLTFVQVTHGLPSRNSLDFRKPSILFRF